MTTAEKNKLVRETLKQVNLIRKATGRKPLKQMPKGYQDEPMTCPIATALNTKYEAHVIGREFELYGLNVKQAEKILRLFDTGYGAEDAAILDGGYIFYGPEVFGTFVGEFDNGEIPELVKEDE